MVGISFLQYFTNDRMIHALKNKVAMKTYFISKKSSVRRVYGSKYFSGEKSFIFSSSVMLPSAERKKAPKPKVMAALETERTLLEKVENNIPNPRKTNCVKNSDERHNVKVPIEMELLSLDLNKITPVTINIRLVAVRMIRSDKNLIKKICLRLTGLVSRKSAHLDRFSLEKVATDIATAIIAPMSAR